MAAKKKTTYGCGRLLNVILAIIPITNIILGIVKRAEKKNWIGVVLNILFFFIFYFVDLITIILYDELKLFAH